MKASSILGLALCPLLTFVTAAPLNKKDIVWYTVLDEVVETVEVIQTVWVGANDVLSTAPPGTTTALFTTTTTVFSSPSSTGQILLQSPISSSTSVAPPPPPPTTTPAPPPPPPTTTPAPSPPPPATTPPPPPPVTTPPPPPPAPAVVSTSVAPAPAPAAPSASPAASNAGNVTLPGAVVGSACTPGMPCVGDMTYYNPSMGLGACGPGPDGYVYQDTDMVVAVSHLMMGSLSSGDQENALCWKKLHIYNPATGETNTGMVVDKCMGCPGNQDIDLSPTLFDTLGNPGNGRYHDVQWYWA